MTAMPGTGSRAVVVVGNLLPAGFRFHPTDEELILHYLTNQASSIPCPAPVVAELNIYHYNPWDLPGKALFGEKEWYFFSPRERKYPNGARPNRAAGSGYWKATGTDKPILLSTSDSMNMNMNIGVKKALVFYSGKPPKGVKTDWIMHEYRLITTHHQPAAKRTSPASSSSKTMRLDDWVLCRIHKKSNDFQFQVSDHQEQEGSTVEEDHSNSSSNNNNDMINSTATVASSSSTPPKSEADDDQLIHHPMSMNMNMSKSCSLTDLLNTIDYSALSQLLLDAPPQETDADDELPHQSPLIYPPPHALFHELYHHYDNNNINNVDASSNYSASYNNKNGMKRKRVMTTSLDATTACFDDDGSSNSFTKKPQLLPSDSRSSSFGAVVASSCYCNQPQLLDAGSNSVEYYNSLGNNPFLNEQPLHLGMQ